VEERGLLPVGSDFDELEASRLGVIHRGDDGREVALEEIPVVGAEDDEGEFSALQVLLVGQVLIASDYEFEAGIFRGLQEFAVFEDRPAHCFGGADFVIWQRRSQLVRDVVVEQQSHA
jgi:hypothetical protein